MKDVEKLIEELREILQPWRSYLIAIDGRDGVGKSPLGRRLAWELQVPLVETDLYLAEGGGGPAYYQAELKRVLSSRLNLNRPVIVEGILARKLLGKIGLKPDYVVYVTRSDCEGSFTLAAEFAAYGAEFPPVSANYQVLWPE